MLWPSYLFFFIFQFRSRKGKYSKKFLALTLDGAFTEAYWWFNLSIILVVSNIFLNNTFLHFCLVYRRCYKNMPCLTRTGDADPPTWGPHSACSVDLATCCCCCCLLPQLTLEPALDDSALDTLAQWRHCTARCFSYYVPGPGTRGLVITTSDYYWQVWLVVNWKMKLCGWLWGTWKICFNINTIGVNFSTT